MAATQPAAIRARGGTGPGRGPVVGVAAGLAATVLAGCGGGSAGPPAPSTTSAPAAQAPSATQATQATRATAPTGGSPAASSARGTPSAQSVTASVAPAECTAARLSYAVGGGQGAAGTIHVAIRVTNRGPGACWVAGYMDLQLLDAAGHAPLPTTTLDGAASPFQGPLPADLRNVPHRVMLPGGGWGWSRRRLQRRGAEPRLPHGPAPGRTHGDRGPAHAELGDPHPGHPRLRGKARGLPGAPRLDLGAVTALPATASWGPMVLFPAGRRPPMASYGTRPRGAGAARFPTACSWARNPVPEVTGPRRGRAISTGRVLLGMQLQVEAVRHVVRAHVVVRVNRLGGMPDARGAASSTNQATCSRPDLDDTVRTRAAARPPGGLAGSWTEMTSAHRRAALHGRYVTAELGGPAVRRCRPRAVRRTHSPYGRLRRCPAVGVTADWADQPRPRRALKRPRVGSGRRGPGAPWHDHSWAPLTTSARLSRTGATFAADTFGTGLLDLPAMRG